jgi:AcrR family transcriptional regulator
MAKLARTPDDIELIRQNILDTTLEIIDQDGYNNFSMRKLATRLGITATTIYNYYSSKDELYLAVLTRGFAELYDSLQEGYHKGSNSLDRLRKILHAYIEFGITKANFYNIMFTWDVPKYKDYIDTPVEPVAFEELNTALQSWELLKQTVVESGIKVNASKEDMDVWITHILCSVHGIVSLFNSKITDYLLDTNVVEPDKEFLNRFVELLLNCLSKD